MADLISKDKVLRCLKESSEQIDWGQSRNGDAFKHYVGANYRTIAEFKPEQSEADEVAPTIGEGAEGEEVICCGSCGTSLYHLFPWIKINKAREFVQYCRHCGKAVKWDDT